MKKRITPREHDGRKGGADCDRMGAGRKGRHFAAPNDRREFAPFPSVMRQPTKKGRGDSPDYRSPEAPTAVAGRDQRERGGERGGGGPPERQSCGVGGPAATAATDAARPKGANNTPAKHINQAAARRRQDPTTMVDER